MLPCGSQTGGKNHGFGPFISRGAFFWKLLKVPSFLPERELQALLEQSADRVLQVAESLQPAPLRIPRIRGLFVIVWFQLYFLFCFVFGSTFLLRMP